jgi:ABC-type phosphate transport system permease subunit
MDKKIWIAGLIYVICMAAFFACAGFLIKEAWNWVETNGLHTLWDGKK